MTNTRRPDPRPLFTPGTLPQPGVPDPLVTFIEDALVAIANRQDEADTNRQDEADTPEPSA